jgi:hypothetical protein
VDHQIFFWRLESGVFAGFFEKNGVFVMDFCGVFVVNPWCFCGW